MWNVIEMIQNLIMNVGELIDWMYFGKAIGHVLFKKNCSKIWSFLKCVKIHIGV